MALRLAFMGTPDFSVAALNALYDAGHDIVAVYSQPPRPAGRRGLKLTPSAVHKRAEELGIEVRTPKTLRDSDEQKLFADLNVDAAIVVAYGLLLPKPILDAPKHGCFNIHASLLPRWRGAAPIHRAIEAGDAETGVMIMQMDEGLDTGAVALTGKHIIAPHETTGMVHDILSNMGGKLIVEAMATLEAGTLTLVAQSENGVTYAKKITNEERQIIWSKSAQDVHNHIRAITPFPGAFCEMRFGETTERVKVLRAEMVDGMLGHASTMLDDTLTIACGTDAVRLLEVQRAGSKAMSAEEFLRGHKPDAVL